MPVPKHVAALTNTQVKNARAKEREYNLADGKGLYLRVKPSGSRLWIFNYQAPFTKKRSNISLGVYPSVTIAHARAERNACRELLAKDIDPKHHRAQRQKSSQEAYSNTLLAVTDKWFAIKSAEITEEYAEDLYNSLSNHVFPKLGNRPIHQVSAPETIEVLEPLHKAGKLELVKRICQRLNMVMNFAVRTGLIQSNPLYGIGDAFKAPVKVHLPTLKPKELPSLIEAVENASITPTTRSLLYWQLHTMVRPSEAAAARWAEIDFESSIWAIPAERMKKRREHMVPLTPQTLRILDDMKELSGSREFIFPSGRHPKSPASNASVNMALKRMGFKGRIVSHGFRALASTTLNEQGFDSDIIEAALAHVDKNSVRAAYNRAEYLERRKILMCWWSESIEAALVGKRASHSIKQLSVV
jgi:integrase